MSQTFNAIIRQMFAFLLVCVAVLSFSADAEEKEYDVFLGIQCQVFADYADLDITTMALWNVNNDFLSDPSLELSSFDVAYVVNSQFDHAVKQIVEYASLKKISEKQAAEYLFIKSCNLSKDK